MRTLSLVLTLLALLVFLGYLIVFVVYAVHLFRWPYDYDQGEGFELYDAVLFRQGEWPYRDNSTFPFYGSNYPPLFHLLIVPLLGIFGPRLVAGRVVSFTATLVTAATVAWIVHRESETLRGGRYAFLYRLIPVLMGLAFLASNIVYQIGPLSRLHMTMVMFETLAVATMAGFQHPRHGNRNFFLGLLLLLFAGYTKQLAVFTVAAVLGYVFLRDIRRALLGGLALALVAGGIYVWLDQATGGQWTVNILHANVNEFDYRQTLVFLNWWLRLHLVLVLLTAGLLAWELFWDRLSIYAVWFVLAFGMGLLSGKWGAGPAYFTTATAAACVMAGRALLRLGEGIRNRWPNGERFFALGVPVLLFIQAALNLHLPTEGPVFGPLARALGVADRPIRGDCTTFAYYDSGGYTQLGHLLTPADYEAGARILAYIRASDGPPFSEEAAFSLLAGRPVVTNPTQLLNLYKNGLLDTTEIVRRIEAEEFGVVVFRAQFYPQPVLEAIGQHYRPVEHICMNGFYYHILLPKRLMKP
ncbi:MAG: hypothetical protein RMK65_11885 [Anaerolineae bacterium]|nr:hypothetical protein [Anaerolineae bacterium]MCX8067681.1 hypothetical protein [Anaerolineae bacterium]MDW7992792.1 hypothetical protein [Anaerolineae bacterium]